MLVHSESKEPDDSLVPAVLRLKHFNELRVSLELNEISRQAASVPSPLRTRLHLRSP